MRIIQTMVAGVPKTFHVPGNYFFLASVPGGTVSAVFFKDQKQLAEDLRDVPARWSASPPGGFDEVELTSTLSQDVAFYIAKGNVSSVADVMIAATTATSPQGADQTTASGQAFAKWFSQINGGPGLNGRAQLYNPAGSGKIIYFDRGMSLSGATQTRFNLSLYDTALATLVGTGFNKNRGGAASLGQIRRETVAGTPGDQIDARVTDAIGDFVEFEISPPIRLIEGKGVVLTIDIADLSADHSFAWREY